MVCSEAVLSLVPVVGKNFPKGEPIEIFCDPKTIERDVCKKDLGGQWQIVLQEIVQRASTIPARGYLLGAFDSFGGAVS
jgi:hypothetical protein